tara:strand:+ start:352 stop:552 length:201 start_codon:yes stop_codon:yes gene_type:complete
LIPRGGVVGEAETTCGCADEAGRKPRLSVFEALALAYVVHHQWKWAFKISFVVFEQMSTGRPVFWV